MLRKMKITIAIVTLCFTAMSASAEEWGTFSGQLVYGGDAPAAVPIVVSKDPAVCANKGLVDEQLVVNAENKGIANIVVYMYLKSSDPKPKVHESYNETAEAKVSFDNKNCRFEPRVAAITTTQTLLVGNKDAAGHNTKGDCLANPPFNPIIPANGSMELKFAEAERLPVSVSCNIHPWMKGFLLVKDNPYFSVTDKDGKFEIKNVPAGEWVFQFWHEKSGYVDEVVVGGAETKWKKGRLPVEITAAGKDIGSVTVPSATFED